MRYISLVTILLFACFYPAAANNVYNKLREVNKCWSEPQNAGQAILPEYRMLDETEWIKLHLELVEQTLRNREVPGLSARQKQNRLATLDILHSYMQAGRFPQNEDYTYRTPIFIDKHDNFCAVGYLVKATGYEHVSRMISANTNLAYVYQMNYPELGQWAKEYGFTTYELAWIQPAYAPFHRNTTKPLGKGTTGSVYELCEDQATQRLYVGGSFANVDSTITANNIAYVTETGGTYTWHTMGDGLNGPVYAIAKYGSNIFAAGSFSASGSTAVNNVAYWNGTVWQPAGCIYGVVKDLTVFNGDLYAAGSFDVCTAPSGVNFAKWNGTTWQPIMGITGTVNTMEVRDTVLLLGGNFTFGTSGKNVTKWNPTINFQAYANNIANEVKDFESYKDTLYAVCKRTAANDSALFQKLQSNAWMPTFMSQLYSFPGSNTTFNTLCTVADTFMVGGNFFFWAGMSTAVTNSYDLSFRSPNAASANWFLVDSTIHVMAKYKNKIIAGGDFKIGYDNKHPSQPQNNQRVNGICERISNVVNQPSLFSSIDIKPACDSNATGTIRVYPSMPLAAIYIISLQNQDTVHAYTRSNAMPGDYKIVAVESGMWQETTTISTGNIPLDKSVTVSSTGLTSIAGNVRYQWLDCDNGNQPIPGANSATYTPTKTGNYAVRLRSMADTTCTGTSQCYSFIPAGIGTVNRENINIYPNPASDYVAIRLNEEKEALKIEVTDITGRSLISANENNVKSAIVELHPLPAGVYTLKVTANNERPVYFKLVKQ